MLCPLQLQRSALSTHQRRQGAFTLIEIILAIALIGLVSSLLIVGAGILFKEIGQGSLPMILRKAITEARYQAAFEQKWVYLSFDRETLAFAMTDESGNALGDPLESGYAPDESTVDVTFYLLVPPVGLNTRSHDSNERQKIDHVAFHPSGCSTPFEVELVYEASTSRHRYDPFSNLEWQESEF